MILVVGGAGYIGSQLVNELVGKGHQVKVLDRGYFGYGGLDQVKDKIKIVHADMRRVPAGIFKDVDAVINVGGLSNDPTAEYSPEANHEMNVEATYDIAVQAKKAGVRKYVLASSCSIYDRGLVDESSDILLDENCEVYPKAAYGKSKLDAENKIFPLADEKFKVVALRKGTVFGYSPRMRWDLVVNTMIMCGITQGKLKLNYNGQMWRPMVQVMDAVQAYIMAAVTDMEGVYNVSTFNIRVSELAIIVRDELIKIGYPCELELNENETGIRTYRVTSEKIRRIGWVPKKTLRQVIKEIIAHIMTCEEAGLPWNEHENYNIKWMQTIDKCGVVLGVERKSYECI